MNYLLVILLIIIPLFPTVTSRATGSHSVCAVYHLDRPDASPAIKSRRLTARVGDSLSPRFIPQIKLSAWGDECTLVIDLRQDTAAPIVSVDLESTPNGPRIDLRENERIRQRLYALENGSLEWMLVLERKPDDTSLVFSCRINNLKLYYQDSTTAGTACRGPDWAQGSLAAYHALRRHNRTIIRGDDTLREQYRTGKAFHVHRPVATDSRGRQAFGHIACEPDSSLLIVTVPHDFLTSAQYPVTIDPVIGNELVGAWDLTITPYRHLVLWDIGAVQTGPGTITGARVYAAVFGPPDENNRVRVHAYEKGADLDHTIRISSSTVTPVNNTTGQWVACPMGGTLEGGKTYIASVQACDEIPNSLRIWTDLAPWGAVKYHNHDSWEVPDSLTGYYNINEGMSVYIEYQTAEITESLIRRRNLFIGCRERDSDANHTKQPGEVVSWCPVKEEKP